MKLPQIVRILEAEVLCGRDLEKVEVESACGSDLMSDVLSFGKRGSLLLTGLTNPQAARTAEMAEVAAVCFVRGRQPPKETVELALKSRNSPDLDRGLDVHRLRQALRGGVARL